MRKALKDQKLKRFLKMSRITHLDLVKVFYTNLLIDGENMYSRVKRVDMEITHVVWIAFIGLKYPRIKINKGNIGVVEDFNKIQFYVSYLKNPPLRVKGFSAGALKLNEIIIVFIVT